MSEYVIKNKRLAIFLDSLGFNGRTVPNKYIEGEFVYLFPQNEKLFEGITFYTTFNNKG